MNTKIWDVCEDCGSTDIQFVRMNQEGHENFTFAECRKCCQTWYDTYEGMWT